MTLDKYRAKRDFAITPEPRPATTEAARTPNCFVIQRHEARHLHYDLRFAVDGVLKSWAIPKGFSWHTKEKRLAVQTEDHPLDYASFEGVIPAGQYGAGTVSLWDRGPFELHNSATFNAGLEKGKLELQLRGSRLRGEWHMFRLKKASKDWLIFKARDCYAREPDEGVFAINLLNEPRRPIPKALRPAMATPGPVSLSDSQWLYEIRLEGVRVIAEKREAAIRYRATKLRNLATRIPDVTEALGNIKAESALLDGVLVSLGTDQRPSRDALEATLRGKAKHPVAYYAFDLLYYDEWDLRGCPLIERKSGLASILPSDGPIFYVTHERSRVADLFASVIEHKLPGVIAKRLDSPYRAGLTEDWVTINKDSHQVQSLLREPRTTFRATKAKLTNLSRTLWPSEGYTKGNLVDYYDAVADYLLPYLVDRPVSLKRYPRGIDGESFFQKNAPQHYPSWVRRASLPSAVTETKGTTFVVCDDRDTLLYLANQSCIELHPSHAKLTSPQYPDWAVFDLDPLSGQFQDAVRVARELGKLLRGIGLQPSVKTSGMKGLHVYVPLAGHFTFDQVRLFCEGVARILVQQQPNLATIQRAKSARGAKVYIDYLQNRRGQTVVAPYSTRPLPGAPVSAPLHWDELTRDLSPNDFTMHTMPARVGRYGDIFSNVLQQGHDLLQAADALKQLLGR